MSKGILNWYAVRLLYKSDVTGEPDRSLLDRDYVEGYVGYEESIIVVQATNFDKAYDKAEVIAKESEDDHTNLYDQRVSTRFYDFIDCYLIDDQGEEQLRDGLEVYSNIIDSHISVTPKEFMEKHFPLSKGVHYMLLNKDLPLL